MNAMTPKRHIMPAIALLLLHYTSFAQAVRPPLLALTSPPPKPSTPCNRICRYGSNFYDGQVCIGCFREVHEISNWQGNVMTPLEKMYALEDAADRCLTTIGKMESATEGKLEDDADSSYFEGSVSYEELLRQASLWGEYSKLKLENRCSIGKKDNFDFDLHKKNFESDDETIGEIHRDESTIHRHVYEEKNAVDTKENNKTKNTKTQSNNNPNDPRPSTPCNRICRYKSKFYDGRVCIGCFRDEYDVRNWRSFTNAEKNLALEDAAERCSSSADSGYLFDGGVEAEMLLEQAREWDTLSRDEF